MLGFLRGLASTDSEGRFRHHQICDQRALSGLYSTPAQLSKTVKNVVIR